MKKILYLSFITSSMFSMQLDPLIYSAKNQHLSYPQRLGNLSVLFDNNGFKIKKDSQEIPIPSHCLEKKLRGISREQLTLMILNGNSYLVVSANNNDEYSLRLHGRLLSCSCPCSKNNPNIIKLPKKRGL